jgi:hypothetical protein
MQTKEPVWEQRDSGVKVLQLYGTKLNPDWPRIVMLELSAQKFKEFEEDIVAFDEKYKLYFPEYPILAASHCAKPPQVRNVNSPKSPQSWTVVLLKRPACMVSCAACPNISSE